MGDEQAGQQAGEGLLRRRRQAAPGWRCQSRRPLRQAEVELRVRPARSARRLWHGNLPRTRAMLALLGAGEGPCLPRRAGRASSSARTRPRPAAPPPALPRTRRDRASRPGSPVGVRLARPRACSARPYLLRARSPREDEPHARPTDATRRRRHRRRQRRYYGSCAEGLYNRVRPHASLGYRPPAPVTFPGLAFRLPMAATMQ